MTCAAGTTGSVGTADHKDWCDLHGRWTFDCLLKIKEMFYPRRNKAKARSQEGRKA